MKLQAKILKLPILIILAVISNELIGQQEINQNWNAFAQSFDMTNYQGGQFRFKGFVKVKDLALDSHARLWARIDVADGTGFFDNMYQRPIVSTEWKEYIIEGPIAKNAIKLTLGGIGQGNGKYYFDNFIVEVKNEGSDWIKLPVANSGFENQTFKSDWKSYNVKGFMLSLTSENVLEGNSSLFLNAEINK
jgi:hypothetical protein